MTEEDMRDLLEHLSAPMILLGDFNDTTHYREVKIEQKRENVRKNVKHIQPLVPQRKRRKLLQSIQWLQISNRSNTCQPNDRPRIQMEQKT